MTKKGRGIILLSLIIIICLLTFGGCDNHNEETDKTKLGNFYTLQEAYDGGMLTVEDLQVIAEYLENGMSVPEPLSPDIENAIKELAARNLREKEPDRFPDAKAEDFTITKYYGTYNGYVAFTIEDIYTSYAAVCVDETIAGVEFHYPTPIKIIVWTFKYNV